MKKFYIAIFIFSFCFLDIYPSLKSKAFSLKEETLISLNDKNINKNLIDFYDNLITAESRGDIVLANKILDQIIEVEEKNYKDKIYDEYYDPIDIYVEVLEKKYQLADYYYINYLPNKIRLVSKSLKNGLPLLNNLSSNDINLKINYLDIYALILGELSKYKEEIEIRKEIVNLEAQESGENSEYYYDAVSFLASALINNDELIKAKKILRELINKSKSSNPKDLGYYYWDLSIVYANLNDQANEKKYLKDALDVMKKNYGKNSNETAQIYASLGYHYIESSEYEDAKLNLNKALKIQNKLKDKNTKSSKINTYENLSFLYQDLSNFSKSEEYILKAIKLQKELFGEKEKSYGILSNQLASVLMDKDEFYKAIKIYKDILNLYKEISFKGSAKLTTLNDLGLAYLEIGDFDNAKRYLNEAIKGESELENDLGVDYATSIHNLGLVYEAEGSFRKAEEKFLEALELTIKDVGENNYETIVSLSELAGFYNAFGFYKKADKYIEKAIKISEKVFKEDNIQKATNFSYLSDIYFSNANYEKAEKYANKALEIKKKSLPKFHYEFADSYQQLAAIYEMQNNFKKSETYLKKSSEIYINSGEEDSIEASIGYEDLGSLYSTKGSYEKAIGNYQKSLSIKEKFYKKNNPEISSLEISLAFAYSKLNDFSKSSELFKNAVEKDLFYLQKELPLLSLSERQKFYENYLFTDDYLFSVASKNNDLTKIALFKRINNQGLLEEIEKRQSNLKSLSKSAQKVSSELRSTNAELANIKISKKEKNKLEIQKNKLEKKLFKMLPTYKPVIISIEDIAEKLGNDDILIEYQLYQPVAKNYENLDAKYLAFTLDNQKNVKIYDLGSAEKINPAVSKVINSAENKKVDFNNNLQKIKELILTPLEKDLKTKKNIYISPDNELNRIPYSAFNLKFEDSIEKLKNIRVLTSSKELMEIKKLVKNKKVNKTLIVANPTFDINNENSQDDEYISQKRSVDLRNLKWTSLPGTLKEGKAINKIIKANFLTNKEASVLNVQKYESPKLLHIASHSYYLPSKRDELSLLRSGIVLAGANNPFQNPVDDGYLTALEATNLNLNGTDLVVISGCESGQGDVKLGQGFYGLRRSFAVAGAKSQLLSLWKVDDLGTAAFMEVFYENLKKGLPKDIALRNTQKVFQNHPIPSWRHPYIWAAFQLSGSWNPINF